MLIHVYLKHKNNISFNMNIYIKMGAQTLNALTLTIYIIFVLRIHVDGAEQLSWQMLAFISIVHTEHCLWTSSPSLQSSVC